jgi:hypothetical protein
MSLLMKRRIAYRSNFIVMSFNFIAMSICRLPTHHYGIFQVAVIIRSSWWSWDLKSHIALFARLTGVLNTVLADRYSHFALVFIVVINIFLLDSWEMKRIVA